jgi:hypothetical protein
VSTHTAIKTQVGMRAPYTSTQDGGERLLSFSSGVFPGKEKPSAAANEAGFGSRADLDAVVKIKILTPAEYRIVVKSVCSTLFRQHYGRNMLCLKFPHWGMNTVRIVTHLCVCVTTEGIWIGV